jgi:hypothetical protein
VSETNIDSFIIRFVHDRPCGDRQKSANWRGFIRHVQCKESIQFTDFEEALEFIARFVHLLNFGRQQALSSQNLEQP